MSLSFGQPVRVGRDPPADWLARFRLIPACLGRGRLLVLLLLFAPHLRADLLSCLPDPLQPPAALTQARRDPITVDPLAAMGFGGIGVLCFGDHRAHLFGQPVASPVGIDRGVRADLGPVDSDRSEVAQACLGNDQQHLPEQTLERVLTVRPKSRDRAVIGTSWGAQDPVSDIGDTQPLDLARGPVPQGDGGRESATTIAAFAGANPTAGRAGDTGLRTLPGLRHGRCRPGARGDPAERGAVVHSPDPHLHHRPQQDRWRRQRHHTVAAPATQTRQVMTVTYGELRTGTVDQL